MLVCSAEPSAVFRSRDHKLPSLSLTLGMGINKAFMPQDEIYNMHVCARVYIRVCDYLHCTHTYTHRFEPRNGTLLHIYASTIQMSLFAITLRRVEVFSCSKPYSPLASGQWQRSADPMRGRRKPATALIFSAVSTMIGFLLHWASDGENGTRQPLIKLQIKKVK